MESAQNAGPTTSWQAPKVSLPSSSPPLQASLHPPPTAEFLLYPHMPALPTLPQAGKTLPTFPHRAPFTMQSSFYGSNTAPLSTSLANSTSSPRSLSLHFLCSSLGALRPSFATIGYLPAPPPCPRNILGWPWGSPNPVKTRWEWRDWASPGPAMVSGLAHTSLDRTGSTGLLGAQGSGPCSLSSQPPSSCPHQPEPE